MLDLVTIVIESPVDMARGSDYYSMPVGKRGIAILSEISAREYSIYRNERK